MKKNISIKAIAAAAAASVLFAGCGNGSAAETTTEGTTAEYTAGEVTTADIAELLGGTDNIPAEETGVISIDESLSFTTVTDVENEVDRAIYKTQITLPDGWIIIRDTNEGKYYEGNGGSLTVQAENYGSDDELLGIDETAEQLAVSIKIQNMYLRADTDFEDPVHVTVAGQDAVLYNYVVTAYVFKEDENGNETDEKEVYCKYYDRLYVFYNGTDIYYLRFEAREDVYDRVASDFDKMIESFSIAEDGTAGYESASIYMSAFEEYSQSVLFSMLEEEYAEDNENPNG